MSVPAIRASFEAKKHVICTFSSVGNVIKSFEQFQRFAGGSARGSLSAYFVGLVRHG